jgi:hypothetical protein
MSTRSRIGIQNADGTIRSIYCHFDGYFDGVGGTLLDSYTDPAKVEALIALGDLSSLYDEVAPPEGVSHSFGNAAPGVTVAYHRDRSEPHRDATHADEAAYIAHAAKSWGEYVYLFKDGQWFATTTYSSSDGTFRPLADAMKAQQAEDEAEEAA